MITWVVKIDLGVRPQGLTRLQCYTGGHDLFSQRHAGPDVPSLLLPASASSLCRLGQPRGPAAAAGAWRPRPLPQLGLGGPGAARRLAYHLSRPARAWRQPM